MDSSEEAEMSPVEGIGEQAARLRAARSGKMSHLTPRMNIMNNLIFLDEEARKEDNEAWYKPRRMQIMAFVRRVNNWISQADDAGAPSEGGVASSAVMQEEEDPAESGNFADVDNTDAQSVSVSNRSNSSTLSSSLRIGAEAERLALVAKASRLKEKHAIEEQEQMLRKKRETLELDAEIEAATVKINYLNAATNMSNPVQSDTVVSNPVHSIKEPVLGAESAQVTSDASTAIQAKLEERLDYSLHPHDGTAPAVRSKTGTHVKFPLLKSGADRQHLGADRPTFHPSSGSDIRSQQPRTSTYSFPSAQHSSHSYSSDIPPVIPHASSDQGNHIIHVLENQSELTRMLMKQQLLATLPQRNIPLFDGHVLEYKSFIHSIEQNIERKTDNNTDRLQFLI